MTSLTHIIFIIIFILINTLNAQEKHFKVSYDPDYAPFSYLEDGMEQGLLVDYWKLWAQKNNYSIEFINAKLWNKAILLAKNKEVDFFLGTNPYDKWMKSSNSFYKTQTSLFILKNNSKGFSKNASYIIGIIGNDYEKIIKKNFPNSQLVVYEDYESILNDFTNSKIDLIYEDKLAIEYYTLQNKLFHKIRSIPLLKRLTNIKAISADENLIKIFNEGLEKISKEELFEIENKWVINKNDQFYEEEKDFTLTEKENEFIKNKILNISVSKNWQPFTFESKNGQISGISSEIWEIIENKLDLKVKYNFNDIFSQQLDSIKNKTNDIIYSTGKTYESSKYSIFTKPYASFPISIVTLKDENFIENMDFLFDRKIAVGNNFTAHRMLKEKYPNLNFILVDNIKEGLKKVSNFEAYAYIDIKQNLSYNIAKYEFNDLKISGNTGLVFKLRIMIRDDYKILQSILNKAITSLDKNKVDTIIQKWTNVRFEETFDYQKFWIILTIVLIIVLLLIYFNQINIIKNKRLKSIVNERTKELKELNSQLEELVDIKTKELKRANYLLDEAQKMAHLGSFNYNIKKNELFWSDEHYKIFGLYPKEIIPSIKKFFTYVHKDDRKIIKNHLKKLISTKANKNKKLTFEYRIIMKNSSIKYLQAAIKITRFDSDMKPLIMVGTILDITKVKYLELEKREKDIILAQKSKMAAMGEMLENIAHQWRQPLSVISTASTGLQLQLEFSNNLPPVMLEESLNSINEQSQYLSKTIDDFRNFFHQNKEKEKFDIKNSIEKSLYLVSSRVKNHNIHIIKNLEEIEIKTLENELIQVFLNIINNAIDKLNDKKDDKYIFISTKIINNELNIHIKDNGGGIPNNIINRVFEPYFTTKHRSQGTGIGLYMSNEIISKHIHGTLSVDNISYDYKGANFYGALFKITIPLI